MKNAAGQVQDGVLFLGQDGRLVPVALPDQQLPDGDPIVSAEEPSINDAGTVAFLVRRKGDGAHTESAYVWADGALTPVVGVGQAAPGGGRIAAVWAALVNNKTHNVAVVARLNDSTGPDAVYLFANGQLSPVAVPGQPLPGGGTFGSLQSDRDGISFANGLGQHALLTTLQDQSTAAYRMEPDGSLSLLLRNGVTTSLGTVTNVGIPVPPDGPEGVGIGLNTGGQVALNVKINKGVTTLVLLTPSSP